MQTSFIINNNQQNTGENMSNTLPTNSSPNSPTGPGSWVTFDEGQKVSGQLSATVSETKQVEQLTNEYATIEISPPVSKDDSINNSIMSNSSQTFVNGDIIVTLLPTNESCDWVIPAKFKPHLVPEELMAQSLTLTVEDYVSTMSILLNDYRFNLYIILHRRILGIWIAAGILFLLAILFSGWKGSTLFLAGIIWLIMTALGIFLAIFVKQRLYRMLQQCVAHVNSVFSKHNIYFGVDDRGYLSCHKINLIFIYFDTRYCVKFLNDMLSNSEQQVINNRLNNSQQNNQAVITLNNTLSSIDTEDIIITGSDGTRNISQKEKYAEKLIFRYSQRWIREYSRERMEHKNEQETNSTTATSGNTDGATNSVNGDTTLTEPPRHCRTAKCFCQYIEQHLKAKPTGGLFGNLGELFM